MTGRAARVAGSCWLLAALAACTSAGPDYQLPQDSAFAQAAQRPVALDARGSAAVAPARAAVEGAWWKLYDDARLNALIEQALRANAELKVAAARLEQAQASYAQARAASGLSRSAEATVGRTRISAESLLQPEMLPLANAGVGNIAVSYQLDLFGKLRRAAEAARADAEAAQAAGELARISIAARVAEAYVAICHGNHELAVARHALQLQQRSRDVAEQMRAAGRGTPTAVKRADAQVAALQAALPPIQARTQAAGYALAALLGRTPDEIPPQAMQCEDAPALKQPIPLGDGAALLRRRPDVRRAERELAAATAGIGVATAMLYPDITLGASFGSNGTLADFGHPLAEQWFVGPAISWSLPGNGARARVQQAQAGAKAALAGFDLVVLNALRETQTLLDRYAEDLRLVEALREARARADAAAEDARGMYRAGRAPYLSSLDAQRTLAGAEASLASAQAQLSQDQIQLFLALGGGWRQDASESEGADDKGAAVPAAARP
jgi:NodT family efflux transporter outer membrane factor (OMF) lipoprotein